MTDKQLFKMALEALKEAQTNNDGMEKWDRNKKAITALEKALAQPEQKMVMWPCLIDTADFSKGTVTVVMQCEDYKVSAGTHWLSITPPKENT
jgi:hypothetical protein